MRDKAILENDWTLESISDCYKNQKMYDKAVNNYYPHAFLVYKAIVNLVAFTKFWEIVKNVIEEAV